MTFEDAPDVLTVPEAARLARVGRNAMYQAVTRGEIYSVRIGRSVRIPTIALRRFLGVDRSGDAEELVDPPDLALAVDLDQGRLDRADPNRQEGLVAQAGVKFPLELVHQDVERGLGGGAQLGSAASHRADRSAPDHTTAGSRHLPASVSPGSRPTRGAGRPRPGRRLDTAVTRAGRTSTAGP